MFSVFAGIAIVLAAIGLFAVTAYSVTQRTQEIGLRMALGARTRQIAWLILRRGLVQLIIGVTLGLAGAFAVGRLLRGMLFQTGPADPVTLVSITVLLMTIAISASLWPAWQATRLDPVTARQSSRTTADESERLIVGSPAVISFTDLDSDGPLVVGPIDNRGPRRAPEPREP
jgi:ABC-type lipoprotein release transport system permease subunit